MWNYVFSVNKLISISQLYYHNYIMHCLHLITYNFQPLILMPRSHRSIKISNLLKELLKMYKSSKNQRARSIQLQIPEILVRNVNGLVSVQPGKFRKNTFWGEPLFPVGPVWSKNDRSIRPFRLILIHSGGFSLLVQLLWCNCTQPRKFAIPRLSSYYG